MDEPLVPARYGGHYRVLNEMLTELKQLNNGQKEKSSPRRIAVATSNFL